MAIQTYNLIPSRTPIYAERKMLKHAEPLLVFGSFGQHVELPKNRTDTIVLRRALPVGFNQYNAPQVKAADYLLQEGVTPSAMTIQYQDVSATIMQYGVLFKLSSKVADLYEDNIPTDMVELTGEHIGTLEEMIIIAQVTNGSNVVYANGTTRAGLNTPIGLNRLRQTARILELGHTKRVTKRLAPSVNFGTSAIHAGYLVFVHTDLEADIRNLPGFVPISEYGSYQPVHEREFGACEQYRFISTTYLRPYLTAGASVGAGTVLTGGVSGSGNADVYPIVIVGQDAWGSVAVKGMGSVKPIYLKPSDVNHANPLAMFGYVGAQFWKTAVRLNEQWMLRFEVCASAL